MDKKKNKQNSASKKKTVLAILVLILVVTAVLFSFNFFKPGKKIKNVLLISIDTCRADYLSCYGYPQKTTPNIDSVAADGVLFERCISPVPLTLPSHISMLTGTNPIYHGVHDNTNYRLDESNLTLAKILQQNGFFTGAIVSSFVLDTQFGLNQGFDTYHDSFSEIRKSRKAFLNGRKGDKASELACQWLQEHRKKPFFLFLHYFDPHTPYEPPAPFSLDYSGNRYAGEIAFTDFCINQVIQKLKDLDLYDSTLLIITSDHGESLYEHSEKTHGFFIYQSTIHVPLIVRAPGGPKGEKINRLSALVDIVPTVCNMLDIELPPTIHGKDLSAFFVENQTPPAYDRRYIYCESVESTQHGCNPLLGLVNDKWKYIQAPRQELYDLTKDPKENENLATKEPKQTRLLQDRLKAILQEQLNTNTSGDKQTINAESRRRLESLGYIASGNIVEDFEFDNSKNDPKDFIKLHQQIMWVNSYLKAKQYEKAENVTGQMLRQKPDFILSHFFLGQIALEKNDTQKAVSHLSKFLSLLDKLKKSGTKSFYDFDKYLSGTYASLASCFSEQQDFDKAETNYLKTIEINPGVPETYYNLGNLYLKQDKFDQAAKNYIKALDLNQDSPEANYNLGLVLQRQGKLIKAVEYYKKAIKLKPDWSLAQRQFLAAKDQQQKIQQSITMLTESLSHNPNQPEVQMNLGALFLQLGNIEKAHHHWQAALKLNPDNPLILNNLAYISATEETSKFYNPSHAIKLAEKACRITQNKNPALLDTLAVAYAADDRLDEAIKTAQKALSLAFSANQKQLADEIQSHLEIYKSKLAKKH